MDLADRLDLADPDTRFRFGLPDLPDPIDYQGSDEPRTDVVLIIEDDPDTARFVEVGLRHGGFDVAIEGNGDAGLERIGREDFDLVLCGFMMPGLLGDEVVQRLRARARTRNLPVVMLTSQAGVAQIDRAMGAGADDYITKPFDPIELLAHIRAVLRRRAR
jgi:DNA-binding response OmpR family regulator